jgi:hypothetical protein
MRTRELGGEGFRRGRGEEEGAVRCGVLRGSSGWLLWGRGRTSGVGGVAGVTAAANGD